MKIRNRITLERLIGKIDNDFNISESDWIPRVAAWCIDALSQMKILPMEKKKRTLEVSDKVAIFPCKLNATDLRVFDKNGNEIPEANLENNCCNKRETNSSCYDKVIGVFDSNDKTGVNNIHIANIPYGGSDRNFVLDCNKIELNFDTDEIVVESYETATYYDEYYDCECPYIYDNGLLLEALAWYCMFKYLSRGSKHIVYDLKSPAQATNPYLQWMYLKPKAMVSVKNDISRNNDGWNNFFYNSTFLPRT